MSHLYGAPTVDSPEVVRRIAVSDINSSRGRMNTIIPALPEVIRRHHHIHHNSQPYVPIQPTQPTQIQQPSPTIVAESATQSTYYHPHHLETVVERAPFKPPLPWYSAPGEPFPSRKRRPRGLLRPRPVESRPSLSPPSPTTVTTTTQGSGEPSISTEHAASSQTPSESDSTYPSTPWSSAPPSAAASSSVRLVPAVPTIIPKPMLGKSSKEVEKPRPICSDDETKSVKPNAQHTTHLQSTAPSDACAQEIYAASVVAPTGSPTVAPAAVPAPIKPMLWADLLKSSNKEKFLNNGGSALKAVNGTHRTLEDTLKSFQIIKDVRSTPFLEPRGLVNTGNMCYMNAILQLLVYCGPFYYFLDRISASTKSFKDDTPLTEAMVMFMREFRVISNNSTSPTKSEVVDCFGEPFAPEYVYETTRNHKRFSHMRRGYQQDAEEFFGILLDGLHEEAVKVMKKADTSAVSRTNGNTSDSEQWMEVGHKQKAATTRTTEITESPITKIFGGKLRSVFSVPGLPKSMTLEPYTPLQLDIQAPEVKSVVDALKHLATTEIVQGDWKSPKGPNVSATKQIFIESLPPMLILHLKRFQYDNTGGTQKIWKQVAYPLELEIPREAMSPMQRTGASPKYNLRGVVYHHGNSAQGGHYTADVLRQDSKSWMRFDDTTIKMVPAKDVVVEVKDVGKYNNFDGEEGDGPGSRWEQVQSNGGTVTPQNKTSEGKRYVGKDSKVAYILLYQKL